MSYRAVVAVVLGFLCATSAWTLEDPLEQKLGELLSRHQNGADQPKAFEIPEEEANDYIRQQRIQDLPDGVENPWVKFEESLAVVGATLDLDKLESSLPESAIFQLLSGRVPVEIAARINAAAGVGKLVLERVTLAGVDLPPDMVSSLVSGEDAKGLLPPGFALGEAFTLPFDLESITCQPGLLTVLQRAGPGK